MVNNLRTISPSLAPLISELELNQPELITIKDIGSLSSQFGIKMSPARVAHELAKRGWILQTGVKGVYEFSPGANAGAYSRGGELLRLKAASLAYPKVKFALSMSSALYLHGMIRQFPDIPQISIQANVDSEIPYPFKKFDFHKFNTEIGNIIIKNIPVERLETILVYACSKLKVYNSCYTVRDSISEIWNSVDVDLLIKELNGQKLSTRKRLAKLLRGVAPDNILLKILKENNDKEETNPCTSSKACPK